MFWHVVFTGLLLQRITIDPPPLPPPPDREIVVEAGRFDRKNTVVAVQLRPIDAARSLVLKDARGRIVPIQVDDRGHGTFILESLGAGSRKAYRLSESAQRAPVRPRVKADQKNADMIRILADGKPALVLQGRLVPPRRDFPGEHLNTGYLHPVFTPSGVPVTEAYPEGAPQHRGLWSYWRALLVDKIPIDFWVQPGKSGRTQMESKGPVWEGPVHGGLWVRRIFTGVKPFEGRTMVHEDLRVTVYRPESARSSYFMFDVESEQKQVANASVQVPKGPDGGIAVRGRSEWTAGKGIVWLTSEDRVDVPRARWCYMGGVSKGRQAGIAVLSYPGNPDAPQPLVSGEKDNVPFLNFSPNRDKPLVFGAGRPYQSRYRFVAMDGRPDPKLLERLWNDFAFPPAATVANVKRIARSRGSEAGPRTNM